ncbi:1-acyl-sn-glycerol-3-phosphate acyltransferase [Paraliomyxa miuraensis]|uniref:1-acyl-sn-glycerol-3-phosphate acyltransferase n=1 Tax=Paraliomyxa miuraensis TaxID=376150 RepID=UPI002256F845|nr:1-acyl-sn-glycerol-3-phosphate acyltransferase [Paraliomyxa miuraensis]MCX4247829.1 1-acyl-sn-glycerol-3-phosphate acyltransferase [Paraliomyxa miuraensis]
MTRSRAYPWIQLLLRAAVNLFFRRIEVAGLRNIPREGGGLVVSWHPNGLVDPGLVLTQCPRPVVFGARHGLFSYPLLGSLLREVGTVPIYRASDMDGDMGGDASQESRRAANRKSLEALAERVAEGSLSALFPEGISHDEPGLQALRSGAARLYYRARQLAGEGPPPAILLVGLHYDDKQMFRSSALVTFHPPLSLPPQLDVTPEGDVDSDAGRELCHQLTTHMEQALREVVHATDSWAQHDLMHRARRLVRAERAHRAGIEPERTTIGERVLGFSEIRTGYQQAMQHDPARVNALMQRVRQYDTDLRAMRLEDYDLDAPPSLGSKWIALLLAMQMLGVFLLLPPLVALGYLINLPTALLLIAIAKLAARKKKDEATVKLVAGMLAFPLTWIAAGVLAGIGHHQLHLGFPRIPDAPWLAGMTMASLGAVGGAAALRYLAMARETARAVRVRLTRSGAVRSVARLRRERSKIFDELVALVESSESEQSMT